MQLTHPDIPQHSNAAVDIASIERIVEPGHGVPARVRDFLHLCQLVRAAGSQVQEGKTIEVLSALVRLFHDLRWCGRMSVLPFNVHTSETGASPPCGCLA